LHNDAESDADEAVKVDMSVALMKLSITLVVVKGTLEEP
jgi:hypothetical protein